MFTKEVLITSPADAKKFVDIASRYKNFEINLKNGDYLIDGHSIMGLLSLDLTKTTQLCSENEPTDEFIKDMDSFLIKN